MPEEQSVVSAETRGGALVLMVHVARFDGATAGPIQEAIEAAAERTSAAAVVIDLGEVEELSSVGLGVLVHLHALFVRSGMRFAVCGARGGAAEAIRITRLDRLFEVRVSVADFLTRLRQEKA